MGSLHGLRVQTLRDCDMTFLIAQSRESEKVVHQAKCVSFASSSKDKDSGWLQRQQSSVDPRRSWGGTSEMGVNDSDKKVGL